MMKYSLLQQENKPKTALILLAKKTYNGIFIKDFPFLTISGELFRQKALKLKVKRSQHCRFFPESSTVV